MIYAILIVVGDYKDIGATDLPTYKYDLEIMRRALHEGLRIPDEYIRSIAGLMTPFSKEIYIGRQAIVGMRFQVGSDALIKDLKPSDKITFLRDPLTIRLCRHLYCGSNRLPDSVLYHHSVF